MARPAKIFDLGIQGASGRRAGLCGAARWQSGEGPDAGRNDPGRACGRDEAVRPLRQALGLAAGKCRAQPARPARRFMEVSSLRLRRIAKAHDADVAEAVDSQQGILPRPHMPSGKADKVPDQPRPEHRPDMIEIRTKTIRHARECGMGERPAGLIFRFAPPLSLGRGAGGEGKRTRLISRNLQQ